MRNDLPRLVFAANHQQLTWHPNQQADTKCMAAQGDIRIGISGWRYKGWRGSFYPEKLPQRAELEYAARHFNAIELNGSFYSLQRPEHFARWYDETPPGFVFSVKGSRYVTHMLRLLRIETALANFFAQGVLRLNEKLGPILWQFPPQVKFDPTRFAAFFSLLPRTHAEAADLARLHDHRLDGRAYLDVAKDRPMRHCVEIRHDSFVSTDFIALLRRHRVGLVVADTVDWPLLMDVTADFVYCRLHGSEQLYASGYEPKAISDWADRVHRWSTGQEVHDGNKACAKDARLRRTRDVYVFFDNDAKVRAPFDAQALTKAVSRLSSLQLAS
ncbi:DUF72 domain-containing protein [Occallatibacter riparius]|uniref:DUF72 domain-containing protein n=1 Tax=Occallatibacter riparius TaxID=1002689 RepID=A0A9J7BK99_9BACT|nr:DUF72 domain-containing protein [Occallatibacter riparius]UWZ82202.1 DUF72 domain-containing protein [Occallatibacter riparius]